MTQNPPGIREPAYERWDRAFELLASEPRRMLIVSLLNVPPDSRVRLPEAADSPNQSMDSETLSVHLRHHHLPKLADAEYIRWSNDPFTARRGSNFDEARVPIEIIFDSLDQLPRKLIDGCNVLEEMV